MTSRDAAFARGLALRAVFEEAGAAVVETPILQPADLLLDLYGEEIRARAYVTSDALRGEQMLRPDFTVPVVQMHMGQHAETARYTYCGEVFRRQEQDPTRANEYCQVGYEIFDRHEPADADAEVFALFEQIVAPLALRAATGDIGILTAAVHGLQTTDARKTALLRHIWRPRRFRSLLERYAGRVPPNQKRQALIDGTAPPSDAPVIGKRSRTEIERRIALLREDAETAPIGAGEVDLLDALLNVREMLPFALQQLSDLAVDMPSIAAAVSRIEARAEAMAARGINTVALPFEASYGRTSMEYYDGFVFGFHNPQRPDLPPLATGGRYDALTRRLGGGSAIPAVGGVLRPDLILQAEAAT